MDLLTLRCPDRDSENLKVHSVYLVQAGEEARTIFGFSECARQFSQT